MIFKEMTQQLINLYPTRHPVYIWGAPGLGKSAIGRTIAAELDIDFCDFRTTTLDPVDLRGLPFLKQDQTMDFAPMAALPTSGNGILFLDELNTAPPAVQAAAYQLVLDRRIGDYVLPEGWWVLAAGNRESDRAVTYRMPTALMNRMTHIQLEPDLDSWVNWALTAGIQTEIIAFLRYRGSRDSSTFDGDYGMLFQFDPTLTRDGANKGYPTPRSWAFVSQIMNHVDDEQLFEFIKGTVGEAAALEFTGFLGFCREVPDPSAILLDPDSTPVPNNLSAQYGLATALASLISRDNLDRAKRYLDRCAPEIAALAIHLAIQRDSTVTNCRAYIEWSTQNQNIIT